MKAPLSPWRRAALVAMLATAGTLARTAVLARRGVDPVPALAPALPPGGYAVSATAGPDLDLVDAPLLRDPMKPPARSEFAPVHPRLRAAAGRPRGRASANLPAAPPVPALVSCAGNIAILRDAGGSDRTVRVGTIVDGYTVVAIDDSGLTLARAGSATVLRLAALGSEPRR